MGLVESFGKWTKCPSCGQRVAKQALWMLKCANPECSSFDPRFAAHAEGLGIQVEPSKRLTEPLPADRVLIRYRNHRDAVKAFDGERASLTAHGNHVGVRVAPTSKRIFLARERILNLPEFAADIRPKPEKTQS